MVVLETRDLCKNYGRIEALRGVSLRVERGEIYGLLGQNGAGKTTLVKILLGITRADTGKELWVRPGGSSNLYAIHPDRQSYLEFFPGTINSYSLISNQLQWQNPKAQEINLASPSDRFVLADGRSVVCRFYAPAPWPRTVRQFTVVDFKTGAVLNRFPPIEVGEITPRMFPVPDGKHVILFSLGQGAGVRLWDALTGQVVYQFLSDVE